MDLSKWRRAALALGLALTGAACTSGGGGDGEGGGLTIVSCSLGCSSSDSSGGQVSCGITDVFLNQEIRITFSQPLDLNTVSNNSFRMVEVDTGRTPPGTFRLDSTNPRVLVYRPQLTFDSTGNPVFGLTQNQTYRLTLPGVSQGDLGPFIRSTSGESLQTRLLCTLLASRGVFDTTPGRPTYDMTVTRVETYDANDDPATFSEAPAAGATQVFRLSEIEIEFDDVMNPATLVNPVSGTSNTISVSVDPDGDPADDSDQVPVDGEFTITIDQTALVTTVVFRPTIGFPSAGSDLLNPRRIVVNLSASIADLGSNGIVAPGNTVFTPEVITFPVVEVLEDFTTSNFEDSTHSGSPWGPDTLAPGLGGGSGRLGDLIIPAGSDITLNTDSEDFTDSLFDDPAVFNLANLVEPVDPFRVDGGQFEFARLLVEAGAALRFEGSNPARLFVRGECIIQGTLDLSGLNSPNHDSEDSGGFGGTPDTPGAGGSLGGDGGQRPDGGEWVAVQGAGVDNPNDPGPVDPSDPAQYTLVNGQDGQGVLFPDAAGPGRVAGGNGGLAWPQPDVLPAPDDDWRFPENPMDNMTFPYDPQFFCQITAPGGVGAGGAYSLSGFVGQNYSLGVTVPPQAAISLGGDAADLALDAVSRSLDPDLGFLRGGSGGGGGGGHLFGTTVNGLLFNNCAIAPVGDLEVNFFAPHSGAAGGSSGGALQIQTGDRLVVNGVIDASGGNGGGSIGADGLAAPGGGGSGGAILLQGGSVVVQSIPGRLDVSGGVGGIGPNTGSSGRAIGGAGGPGLVRIETGDTLLDASVEGIKVTPDEATLVDSYGPGASSLDVVSTALWDGVGDGNAGFSGAQSCWFSESDLTDPDNPTQPIQNFFQLEFEPDGAELGWDMLLRVQGFADPQSYRGENDITGPGGLSLQDLWGDDFGAGPVVVRFQGAKAVGSLDQPCSVPLAGLESQLVPGSLTGWVDAPFLLQSFFADPALTPNIFRFIVIWDSNDPSFPVIEGVEQISIRLRPD